MLRLLFPWVLVVSLAGMMQMDRDDYETKRSLIAGGKRGTALVLRKDVHYGGPRSRTTYSIDYEFVPEGRRHALRGGTNLPQTRWEELRAGHSYVEVSYQPSSPNVHVVVAGRDDYSSGPRVFAPLALLLASAAWGVFEARKWRAARRPKPPTPPSSASPARPRS